MCTLILDRRHQPTLFSNRDENRSRSAIDPYFWETRPVVFAPQDLVAHGTWVGVNEFGVAAAITNRFGENSGLNKTSRGELVLRALKHHTAKDASKDLQEIDFDAFNGFHLLYFDRRDAFVTIKAADHHKTERVDTETFVVSEQSYGGIPDRDLWVRNQIQQGTDIPTILRTSDPTNPVTRPEVDVPEMNYGTRSRATIALFPTSVEFTFEAEVEKSWTLFQDN